MSAGALDITIEQGATFLLNLVWKDSLGALINLTGYTARMMVRQTHVATTVLMSLTSPTDITLGGALGTINVKATAAVTALLPARNAVYDLEMVGPDGTVTRLIEGAVTVTPEVTR